MADGTSSGQGQWPEEQKPKLDTGEGETPLTTPPKIDIRTMSSDKKSLEEGGGVQPRDDEGNAHHPQRMRAGPGERQTRGARRYVGS